MKIVEQRRKDRAKARAYVSLNARGEIAMNATAFARIGEPASVTLLYDAGARVVGVKFPVAADENFFRVRRYGRGGRMRIVRASRLLKQFDITIERTLVFTDIETAEYNGSPMLILPLDEAAKIKPRQKSDRQKDFESGSPHENAEARTKQSTMYRPLLRAGFCILKMDAERCSRED